MVFELRIPGATLPRVVGWIWQTLAFLAEIEVRATGCGWPGAWYDSSRAWSSGWTVAGGGVAVWATACLLAIIAAGIRRSSATAGRISSIGLEPGTEVEVTGGDGLLRSVPAWDKEA